MIKRDMMFGFHNGTAKTVKKRKERKEREESKEGKSYRSEERKLFRGNRSR